MTPPTTFEVVWVADDKPLTRWQRGERKMLCEALTETEGNITHAASWLGITATTLRNKARRYEVDIRAFVPPGMDHRGRKKLRSS